MINPDASIIDKLKGVKELARWVKSSDQIMQLIIDAFNSRGLDFTEELFYRPTGKFHWHSIKKNI